MVVAIAKHSKANTLARGQNENFANEIVRAGERHALKRNDNVSGSNAGGGSRGALLDVRNDNAEKRAAQSAIFNVHANPRTIICGQHLLRQEHR